MCGELPGVPSAPEGPGFSLPLCRGLACPHLALGLGLLGGGGELFGTRRTLPHIAPALCGILGYLLVGLMLMLVTKLCPTLCDPIDCS